MLCLVVLVARHHGRQITRSLDPTGGRPAPRKERLRDASDSDYENRVRKKKSWEKKQDPTIINEINQGVSTWNQKKTKSKDNIIHPEA